MTVAASVLWLRRDLRLADLPALVAAAEAGGGRVLPLFVVDPALWEGSGQARRAWLARSLEALREEYDGALVLRTGRPQDVVPAVAAEARAATVTVSAETTPYGRRRDARVAARLAEDGVAFTPFGTPYAVGPGTLTTGAGTAYQVFTPFSRAWRDHGWPAPAPVPRGLRWVRGVDSEPVPEGGELPEGLAALGTSPGAAGALGRWRDFLEEDLADYDDQRDRPDLDRTSRLSVHLKYGEIHPRTLLADLGRHPQGTSPAATRFVTELAWREFYADVLWHRPDSAWQDLTQALAGMAYDADDEAFGAWAEGRTGFPLVDAGMRQLLAQGWMHNRVRMVTASFLVKDLHQWWPRGARHFLDHLVDGDLASNSHGWQWVSGTGTDAAPYFRVFNPVSQGRRFDPRGDYVRRWVPELRHLPGPEVHEPWRVANGQARGYPERLVDHARERDTALARYSAARG